MVRESALAQLVREYIFQVHRDDPVLATIQGVHDHDTRMTDLSADAFTARDEHADRWLARFDNVEPWSQSLSERLDLQFLAARMKGDVALRPFARWKRQPSLYADAVTDGAYYSVIRDESSTLDERLGRLAERLAGAGAALDAGRANCDPALVAPVYAEIGAQNARGGAAFLRTLPETAQACESESVRGDVAARALAAATALEEYAAWCDDLVRRAQGGTAIGREAFDVLLKEREFTEYDADTLATFGDELVAETEGKLAAVAKELNAGGWREALETIRAEHPSAEELVTVYRREMERSRHATVAGDLATMPEGEWLEVESTPAFARPTTPYAAYVGPAAFGEKRTGKFWVTAPLPDEEPGAIEARLAGHPRAGIAVIACHEGYPGHHLQFAMAHKHISPVRKFIQSDVLIEGWGLYCEELMDDLGYFPTPQTRLLRLRDLLWRAARVKIDIGLSTGTMTTAEASTYLVATAGLEPANADAEVRRYTLSPLQPSSYAIGRAAILKMRVRARDRSWGMKQFHDRLLGLGAIPPKLAEDELF